MARSPLRGHFWEKTKKTARKAVAGVLIVGAVGASDGCTLMKKPGPAIDCTPFLRQAQTEMPLVRSEKGEVHILSANVQGLPYGLENLDKKIPYPENRFECIGLIAMGYDMSFFQEDFVQDPRLSAGYEHKLSPEPSGSVFKTSSGLTILSHRPVGETREEAFNNCSGGPEVLMVAAANGVGFKPKWMEQFKTKADCFANKSFRIAKVDQLTIVDSHLDAGNTQADAKTRAKQLQQIEQALPKTGPLLIAFDANLKLNIAIDRQTLEKFLRRNSLKIAIRDQTDLILVRDVEVKGQEVVSLEGLSDHSALAVKIVVEQQPKAVVSKSSMKKLN